MCWSPLLIDYSLQFKINPKIFGKSLDEFLFDTPIEDFDAFLDQLELPPTDSEKILKIYNPGSNFPSVSLTGSACALNCDHCQKEYLHRMVPANKPELLDNFFQESAQKGISGALISGGCTIDGKLPFEPFLSEISKACKENGFLLNLHCGLVNQEEADQIKIAGIQAVSYDLILDPEVIEKIFHLSYTPEDYINSYRNLVQAGLNISPHILIGARYGKLNLELDSLRFLKEEPFPPKLLIFISLIPPKVAANSLIKFDSPSSVEIAKLIFLGRLLFPNIDIALGCMRVRKKPQERLFTRTLSH